MSQVSRPVQVLLAATVVLAVAWFVALRPKPSDAGAGGSAPSHAAAPTAPGVKGLTTAIRKAHGAVATAAPSAPTAHATPVVVLRTRRGGPAPVRHRADPALARHVATVTAALRHHRAIAIAFVDPGAADSRALAGELAQVSRFGGRALTLSVPIGQLSSFDAITREVQVTTAPTTVIVARDRSATTIVGFADRFEIQQRLADALAQRP